MPRKSFIMLAALTIIFVPFFAFSAGLVPCGGSGASDTPTTPCTLCHLYTLGQTVINFLMWTIAPVIATFAIAWGGFKILISGASPGQRNEGIGIIKKTLTGLLIIFSAWIIINELLLFFASSQTSGTAQIRNMPLPWNKVVCIK